jgi:hypothetical protein
MRSVALPSQASPAAACRRTIDGIDRVAPHRERRHVEDGELLGRRVVAGVVAERALVGDVAFST